MIAWVAIAVVGIYEVRNSVFTEESHIKYHTRHRYIHTIILYLPYKQFRRHV